jgi:hypothetical protein
MLSLNKNENIKMNLNEMWPEDTDWLHLIQDKVQWYVSVNAIMNAEVA